MSDLQDALDWYDAHGDNLGTHVDNMAKAARLVADPNIEAGAKARYEEYEKDAASYKENHPWSWEDLPVGPKAKFRHDARVTIAAALTLGDPE